MGKPWTSHQIYDALRKRGLNLTQIARDAGLYESACREAMSYKGNRRGEHAIHKALGVPLEELFPSRYRRPESHAKPTAKSVPESRQKHGRANDATGARA